MDQDERRSFLGRMRRVGCTPTDRAGIDRGARPRTAKRHEIKSSDDDRLKAMERQMEQMAARARARCRISRPFVVCSTPTAITLTNALYDEVVDLFADDGEVRFGKRPSTAARAGTGGACYTGSFRRRLRQTAPNGPRVCISARSSAAPGHHRCRAGSPHRQGAGGVASWQGRLA